MPVNETLNRSVTSNAPVLEQLNERSIEVAMPPIVVFVLDNVSFSNGSEKKALKRIFFKKNKLTQTTRKRHRIVDEIELNLVQLPPFHRVIFRNSRISREI